MGISGGGGGSGRAAAAGRPLVAWCAPDPDAPVRPGRPEGAGEAGSALYRTRPAPSVLGAARLLGHSGGSASAWREGDEGPATPPRHLFTVPRQASSRRRSRSASTGPLDWRRFTWLRCSSAVAHGTCPASCEAQSAELQGPRPLRPAGVALPPAADTSRSLHRTLPARATAAARRPQQQGLL